jgi:hypothetical protein
VFATGSLSVGLTAVPAGLGDGGTLKIIEVKNTATDANSQALLHLTTGATTNAGAVGAVVFGAPGASGEKRVVELTGRISTGSATVPSGEFAIFTSNAGTLTERLTVQSDGVVKTTSGRRHAWRQLAATGNIVASDYYVDCDHAATAIEATLPTAASVAGTTYIITRVNLATVRVKCTGAETINGSAFLDLPNMGSSVSVHSNGTNWVIH